jgi:histidinol-phosphate aminotransferase
MWFVKQAVRDLAAYHLEPIQARVKVNQNENPYDVPEEIKQEVLARFSRAAWSRYPPFVPADLHAALAAHYGVGANDVLAGNGSNEVLYAALAVCLGPGDKILIPVPTFTLYALLAKIFGADVVTMPLRPDLTIDADALIAEANRIDARVICLCSPNNPTGRQVPRADVERIIRSVRGLVLLDEAYVEFAPECLTQLALKYENVAVFRTFSKAMAYAGLRLGTMIARPPLVTEVAKGKLPYAINTFSTLAAIVACEKAALLAPVIQRLRASRDRLMTDLAAIPGITLYPSQANFILMKLDRPSRPVFDAMARDGVLIRDVSSYPGLKDHLRISVGTGLEIEQTLASLARAMKA